MLVLGRYTGERLFIGDDVVITLLEARNGHARIGIEAPREIDVVREEISRKHKDSPRDEQTEKT